MKSPRVERWTHVFLLGAGLLAGCATQAPMTMPPSGGRYAQSADSATSGCLRNPAC